MQNSGPSVQCALWTVHISVFVLHFSNYLLKQFISFIAKDLSTTLFSRCKPHNEFSLWWCFVGNTLKSVSKQSHCITFFLQRSFIFLLWSVTHFTLFHPQSMIIRCYISIANTLQTSVPVSCLIHTTVSMLALDVRSNPCLSTHSLLRLYLDFDRHMWLLY